MVIFVSFGTFAISVTPISPSFGSVSVRDRWVVIGTIVLILFGCVSVVSLVSILNVCVNKVIIMICNNNLQTTKYF